MFDSFFSRFECFYLLSSFFKIIQIAKHLNIFRLQTQAATKTLLVPVQQTTAAASTQQQSQAAVAPKAAFKKRRLQFIIKNLKITHSRCNITCYAIGNAD